MDLHYDPAVMSHFQQRLRQIPGYPAGEELPIREMVFASGALFRLPELVALAGASRGTLGARPLFVVMDRTPMQRAGVALKPLILGTLQAAGWQPSPIWLEPGADGQVHTDYGQIAAVQERLQPHTAVLAAGSGTVTDIAKHACHLFQQAHNSPPLPLVFYQTANSVSAYTSNMAPVFIDGVKRTVASRYPDVLVCDLETLRDAPLAMTVAGVGDLLAAFSSYADWWLAYRLGMEPSYTPFAQTLMGPLDEILLAHAGAIQQRTLEGMALLAKLIALAGLAMSLAHSTAPLSGYEHVISHVLDLCAGSHPPSIPPSFWGTQGGVRPLAQHGAQVAVATLLTTRAYEQFLEQFAPEALDTDRCHPSETEMHERIKTTFALLDPSGRVAAECWSDYRQKLAAWHDHRSDFSNALAVWPEVRAHLKTLVRPPELALRILHAVGAPVTFSQLSPPVSEIEARFAFFSAPLIRRRFTLGDLLLFTGWSQDALWATVWRGQS
jgi:glycerol-1-phosphate dehydrogenase [NAD(P)+]